jgi:hypothetical protein
MFVSKSGKVRGWTASSAWARAGMAPFFLSGHVDRSDRMKRLLGGPRSGFFADYDMYTPEELERDPDVLRFRAVGLGRGAGTVISLPTDESFGLVVEKEYARGAVVRERLHRLDELRPHLARSALIAARLQMDRARVAGKTLAALGLPALVLNEQGKVLATNSLVEGLAGFVLWRALDRVSLTDRSADRMLRDAIAAIDAPQGGVRSFPVRHMESGAAMIAHVIPIRLSARDVFLRCAVSARLDPRDRAASASRRTGTIPVRSDARGSAGRARPCRGRNRRPARLRTWRFGKHDPHAGPGRFGEDRLQSPDRSRCAAHGCLVGAAARQILAFLKFA